MFKKNQNFLLKRLACLLFFGCNLCFAQSPSINIIPLVDTVCLDLLEIFPLTCEIENVTSPITNGVYTVETINFEPEQISGTIVNLSDDQQSTILDIGFEFCFYGNKYAHFYISSNGFISFISGNADTYTPRPIPSEIQQSMAIMPAWSDWNPLIGGAISYQT